MKTEPQTTPPDATDLHFAARLADIMEQAKGAPLTSEERARTHQHVATARAMFAAECQEQTDD